MKVKVIFIKKNKVQICVCSPKEFPAMVLHWQGLGYRVLNSFFVG